MAGRMNDGDEQLLRGRVYGHDHDDPNPGPLPHQTYAALVGGPLDGLLLDIGWAPLGGLHSVGSTRWTPPSGLHSGAPDDDGLHSRTHHDVPHRTRCASRRCPALSCVNDERRLKRIMKRADPAVYPGIYITCVHDHVKALCERARRGRAEDLADHSGCQPLDCRNVALTGENISAWQQTLDRIDQRLAARPPLPPRTRRRPGGSPDYREPATGRDL
ncbi:hypothetical protein ACFTXM_19545 [Streptomyces sp. NPDC056930]|uniref:hypothetical protein n=1 Tax=Streptomyces sp. NPDC056930 TaxID=3345967 RepID=UPI00363CEF08